MWLRDQTERRLLFQAVFQVCVILSCAGHHRYDVEQIAPAANAFLPRQQAEWQM